VDVFSETWKAFRDLSEVVDLYMLVGNHDQHSKVGNIHSIEAFRDLATVVSARSGTLYLHGLAVEFIPYTASITYLREELKKVRPETDILFMHQPLQEAIPGSDNLMKTTFTLDDVPWENVRQVISGDIHNRQELHNGRFAYVGSPLQLTFGARGKDKGMFLVGHDLSLEFVALDGPKFYQYEFPESADDPADESWLTAKPDRDFVKLLYAPCWSESMGEIIKKYPRFAYEMYGKSKKEVSRVSAEVANDDRALLAAWIKENDPGDLDAERLLADGLEELSGC